MSTNKTRVAALNQQLDLATQQLRWAGIFGPEQSIMADRTGPERAPWRLELRSGGKAQAITRNCEFAELATAAGVVAVLAQQAWITNGARRAGGPPFAVPGISNGVTDLELCTDLERCDEQEAG